MHVTNELLTNFAAVCMYVRMYVSKELHGGFAALANSGKKMFVIWKLS
jgi:hypothetical protein